MLTEREYGVCSEAQRPARAIRLRRRELARPEAKGVTDGQAASIEVDLLPAKGEQLTLPHPGGDREDVQARERHEQKE